MKRVNAILLLYHHPMAQSASTVMEHVNAFGRHSRYKVFAVNLEVGFPSFLGEVEFPVIVLHYSLFGLPLSIRGRAREYVENSGKSYKIAFFQDEYRYWPERSEFLNQCKVDCVYTLLEPEWWDATYRKKTTVKDMVYNIPGYVSDEILQLREKYYKPDSQRTIDIGYRGRRLPYYLGRGSQEKHFIGVEFKKRAGQYGLAVDIETEEEKRIYGEAWPRFIANSRAVLGVEAGVSVFDIDDQVRPQYAKMVTGHPDTSFPDMGFEGVSQALLQPYEDNIYYRTISPRHFEAAALMVCQILFEGKYSGILEPMKHYIPLKKDFSNLDEVIALFKDPEVRRRLTENAYHDLIASGNHTYGKMVNKFDEHLGQLGMEAGVDPAQIQWMQKKLNQDRFRRSVMSAAARLRHTQFPGRDAIKPFIKPIIDKLGF